MIPALIVISDKLKETGMDQVEIDHLMARFLEEEAFNFVDAVYDAKEIYESKDKKITIH